MFIIILNRRILGFYSSHWFLKIKSSNFIAFSDTDEFVLLMMLYLLYNICPLFLYYVSQLYSPLLPELNIQTRIPRRMR